MAVTAGGAGSTAMASPPSSCLVAAGGAGGDWSAARLVVLAECMRSTVSTKTERPSRAERARYEA